MLSHDHVESWLVLKEARQRFRAFLVGSAQNPVAGYVQRGKIAKVATPAGDRRRMDWTDRWARARTMLRDLGFDGTGKLPMHEDPYFMLRRLENATSGDFKALMETGRWDVDDPGKRVTGPGIMEIHDPVRDVLPLYEDYGIAKRQLEKHAQARQFERDNPGKKGYDVLLAEGDEAQAVADLEKFIADTELSHPEIPEVWREFQEFNQWMIGEYAVHHGLLTPEAAKKIIAANQEYITFRYATDDKVLRKLSGKTGQSVNLGSGVKFFKGTLGEPLLPPIPAYLATMHGIIDRAQKTRAARALLTLADFDGNDPERAEKTARWVQRIENPIKGVNIKGGELSEEVMKKLGIWRDAGNNLHVPGELAGMEEEDLEGLVELIQGFDDATFWKPSNDIDEDRQVVRILVEGKFQYYQIMDDSGLLWEMFKGVYAAQKVEGLLGILRWPAMALRAGATQNNISFGLTNVIRDVWYALTLTTTDLKRRDQAMNRLRGVKEAFLGGEWADLYQASGADMEGIFGNEYWNRKKKQFDLSNTFEEHGILTDQSRRALLNDKNLLKAVWEGRVIRNVRKGKPGRAALELTMLPLFGRINSRLERMTRIGEFIQRYKEAKEGGVTSEAEAIAIAAHAAANVTLDWSKGGRISKSVNQYVPFFNAALLGPARIVEHFQGAAKRGPKAVAKAFAGVTTMMVFPSILTFLLTWDDDDYWNIDQRKRDRNWYFPTGRTDAGARTYLRLPKPYGLAAWSILVERSLANLFGINPQTGEFTGDPEAFNWGLLSSVYTELAPTLSVAGAQPLIEVIFTEQGYDFYWENEIVPMRDKDLPVGMQGAERSSNFSRMMGEALGYPPAKIDHLIYGFFAGAGKNVMRDYVDPVVGLVVPSSKDLGRPKDKSEQAFLGAIVRRFREEAGRGRTEAIERFYEDWKDVDAAKRGHNRLVQLWGSGDERVRAFEIKNAYDLERYKQMGHTNRRLSKLWSRLRSSYRDIPDPDALELAIVSIQRDILEEARRPYR